MSGERNVIAGDSALPQSARFDLESKGTADTREEKAAVPLPVWIWAVMISVAIWGSFSANPLLTPVAFILLPLCAQLLWRRGEPPVAVFVCAMLWLQAVGALLLANFYGLSLDQAFDVRELEPAMWLSLIGVLALGLGMRIALVRLPLSNGHAASTEALQLSVPKLFTAYLVTLVFCSPLKVAAWAIPGLAQPLLAVTSIQWVIIFILIYSCVAQRCHYGVIAFVVFLETGLGMLGFFAEFKSIYFIVAVVLLSSPLALQPGRLVLTGVLAAALVALGVVWTAIKSEYRASLNRGTEQQVVLIPVSERLQEIQRLVLELNWNQIEDSTEKLVLRVSYVEYFALCIGNVPQNVPYESGALWLGTLKHIVKPRLLFPEKDAISDSERTQTYTGISVSGAEQGTSIGIGYMGESYIDFGPRYMFVPIVLLGIAYGWLYRHFVHHGRNKLLGFAVASAIIVLGANSLADSNIKLVGGIVMKWIVLAVFVRFFGERLLSTMKK